MKRLKNVIEYVRKSFRNEKGQSMVEYGLIIGILAVAGIILITLLGHSIRNLYPVLEPYLMTIV